MPTTLRRCRSRLGQIYSRGPRHDIRGRASNDRERRSGTPPLAPEQCRCAARALGVFAATNAARRNRTVLVRVHGRASTPAVADLDPAAAPPRLRRNKPEDSRSSFELLRPVLPANYLGLPSACVPAGQDAETGLPIGVLITGPRFRDDLCLDAAEHIERRCGLRTPINPKGASTSFP